jgi:tellurite resistance protein
MTNRYASTNTTASAELAADEGDCRDKRVVQALVTAGAFVALADGHLENIERDELVGFVHRQDFAPTISHSGIAKVFDNRVRELEESYDPNLIIEALRPLAGLSLTSVVMRTAERVAAADRTIHPSPLRTVSLAALRLIRTPVLRSTAKAPRNSLNVVGSMYIAFNFCSPVLEVRGRRHWPALSGWLRSRACREIKSITRAKSLLDKPPRSLRSGKTG